MRASKRWQTEAQKTERSHIAEGRGYQTDKNLARELSFERDVLSSIIDSAEKRERDTLYLRLMIKQPHYYFNTPEKEREIST